VNEALIALSALVVGLILGGVVSRWLYRTPDEDTP
jgi:uncharacterized membrane-anchored protein YhcB (DUF1043 family)